MAAIPKPKMAPKKLIEQTKHMSIKDKAAHLKAHKDKAALKKSSKMGHFGM
jgi:hypothetical protein